MQEASEQPHYFKRKFFTLNKVVMFVFLLMITFFAYKRYSVHKAEQVTTLSLILSPEVNDIYFFDVKLFKNDPSINSKNKYKLAKVIRVTEDNIVLVYGRFFYQWKHAAVNSIKFGDLSNSEYFTTIPDYLPLNKINSLQQSGAIYLVKRPNAGRVYGNSINPQ